MGPTSKAPMKQSFLLTTIVLTVCLVAVDAATMGAGTTTMAGGTTTMAGGTTTMAGGTTTMAGGTTTMAGGTTTMAGGTTTMAGGTTTMGARTTTMAGGTTTMGAATTTMGAVTTTAALGTHPHHDRCYNMLKPTMDTINQCEHENVTCSSGYACYVDVETRKNLMCCKGAFFPTHTHHDHCDNVVWPDGDTTNPCTPDTCLYDYACVVDVDRRTTPMCCMTVTEWTTVATTTMKVDTTTMEVDTTMIFFGGPVEVETHPNNVLPDNCKNAVKPTGDAIMLCMTKMCMTGYECLVDMETGKTPMCCVDNSAPKHPHPVICHNVVKPNADTTNPCMTGTCNTGYECFVDMESGKTPMCCMPSSALACFEPAYPGDCEHYHGNMSKWYFNINTGACEKFPYGGCDRKMNHFDTMELCTEACGMMKLCRMTPPSMEDRCIELTDRWYYDAMTKQCRKFTNGGCKVEGNNFASLMQCELNCLDMKSMSCSVDHVNEPTPFPEGETMWFHNIHTGECEPYDDYAGGTGVNKYKSMSDCKVNCSDICISPKMTGPCNEAVLRYYYNKVTSHCEPFLWGGCQAGKNNFLTVAQCEINCLQAEVKEAGMLQEAMVDCAAPMMTGTCKDELDRYHYSIESNRCEMFTYSGCQGNTNNFLDEEACMDMCKGHCHDVMKVGPCQGSVLRYYYNSTNGMCQEFLWGGCEANRNNFELLEQCENSCYEKSACTLDTDEGPCTEYDYKWFYNHKTQSCETFQYGGCGGNANRFETWDECEDACGYLCYLPMKMGPCEAAIDRYFYNSSSGYCEPFFWGGCDPNGNNFPTWYDCVRRCGEDPIYEDYSTTEDTTAYSTEYYSSTTYYYYPTGDANEDPELLSAYANQLKPSLNVFVIVLILAVCSFWK